MSPLFPRGLRGIACLLLMMAGCGWAAAELGYATGATPGLVKALRARFGAEVPARIDNWRKFARDRQFQGELIPGDAQLRAQLEAVNAYINRIPWVEDLAHWGRIDYWATPAETVASNGGDCEDYAIAKYFLLKEIGIPLRRLRITYVRAASLGQPHMVLAYYPQPDAEPLILDNLDGAVRPASERPDLQPVYSFNEEDVILFREHRAGRAAQIRTWRGLIERLTAEARL